MSNTTKIREAVKTKIYKSAHGEYAIRYYKNSPNTLVIKARGKLYEIAPGDRVRLRRTIVPRDKVYGHIDTRNMHKHIISGHGHLLYINERMHDLLGFTVEVLNVDTFEPREDLIIFRNSLNDGNGREWLWPVEMINKNYIISHFKPMTLWVAGFE